MKTITNQLNYPIGLRLPVFQNMGNKNCGYFFMGLQKKSTNRQQTKIKLISQENAFEAVRTFHPLALKICSIAPSPYTDNVICHLLLTKPGNK